ncbi:AT-rich interactive domain-containing protein 5A isoform X2 [Microcaecilia unicolor]|uniref:AT-rich interactive domain-containing protein 5A isoform X2 n=1 Tax=Microcaecilia unicolor TaxID=1415580 RepID=A0A6P7Y415_9AMPH|nr:AT-rich interactive domain-containing protein 5A isoform X2 [Microcaecilia unicolor]
MASHPKGRCQKQPPYDSMESLDSGNPKQKTAAPDSSTQEEVCYRDLQGQESSSGLEKRPSKKKAEDKQLDHEREEEQTFLVNLYKFMKERNTPIERVPHLGFKQINLWRIHQAVENLGGYELVTGRRLWKNVYDKLGGSPGSTSAATCTRRHYERLVLPYIWYMKGENGKSLPPAKPRKQYRLCKEKGEEAREKNKKMRKEKICEQILVEKETHDSNLVAKEENQESNQQTSIKDKSTPYSQEPGKAHFCSSPQQLCSSLYAHGIMSPLAKKKLLAQASKAGNCGKHGSPGLEDQSAQGKEELPHTGSPSTILQATSPSAEECLRTVVSPSLPANVEPGLYAGKDPQNTNDRPCGNQSPSSPVFTGSFHAYRSDFYKPFACNPLDDPEAYAPAFRSFTELSVYRAPSKDMNYNSLSCHKETDSQRQTTEGHSQARRPVGSWNLDGSLPPACSSRSRESSPFLGVKGCWVPPITHLMRVLPKPSSQPSSPSTRKTSVVQPMFHKHVCSPPSPRKRCMEEMEPACRKKTRTASIFSKAMELKDKSDSGFSKSTQPLVNRPKPLVPGSTFPVVITPSALPQDMYKEHMMLSYPPYLSHTTNTLKNPSPELPSLPFRPFVLPPFSGHLLPTAAQSPAHSRPLATSLVPPPMACDSSLRHRLYPMSTWQIQPACVPLHRPIPQLNTSL